MIDIFTEEVEKVQEIQEAENKYIDYYAIVVENEEKEFYTEEDIIWLLEVHYDL
jgi:hypothetical protein